MWKGNQITTYSTKKIRNDPANNFIGTRTGFTATPLKHYRKEIIPPKVSSIYQSCNERTNLKIDDLQMPNGSFRTEYDTRGVIQTLFDPFEGGNNISFTKDDSCNNISSCKASEQNALRRVRSSGIIQRKFDSNNNQIQYCTDSRQYLESRNLAFRQNQFRYALTDTDCVPTYKPNNVQFAQQGAVSSSALVARKKYDTIQNVASRKLYTQDAIAYGANESQYLLKKGGKPFPAKKYPRVPRFGAVDSSVCCLQTKIMG